MENIDSTISQNVGPVASTTLYRVTRGVIRHEFTIIGFHSGVVAMSWLRTERTARVKEGWINPDSFGPVFSGVEARDLVSFASSREALIGRDVEEVAEVVNLENEPTIIRNGIYLSELAESLAAVSNHYPQVCPDIIGCCIDPSLISASAISTRFWRLIADILLAESF
jgi:hypothetical protein